MLIIEEFKKELQEDTRIDEMNLLEKQMMLPAIKHKWVARLIEEKRNLNKLNRKKKELKEKVFDTLQKNGIPTGIPKSNLEKKIESSESIIKINEDIENSEIIIEYLEKVESIFKSMTFDLKNIVEITKMETT